MKARTLYWLIALALIFLSQPLWAGWIQTNETGGIAYFLNASPARFERMNLSTRQWLAAIPLPAARGTATAAWVDADGVYVAYGRAIYRYSLLGESETPLLNTASDVSSIITNATHIFVTTGANFTSIAKSTNTVVESKSFFYTMVGQSMAPDGSAFFGRSSNVSPSDIIRVSLTSSGSMTSQVDSPHHGDYPNATRTWVFPNGGRVVDSSGTVYAAESLRYNLAFGGSITDIRFLGSDVPIVLRGNELVAYANSLLPAGSTTFSYTPKTIYLDGTDVLVFREDSLASNGVSMQVVPLSTLSAPTPNQPVDPSGLAYAPDSTFLDKNGILYLFSKAHQSLFRWSPSSQSYLPTIPLIGSPDFAAYSADLHVVYLAYNSGLVRKMDLNAATPVEVPFANLSSHPFGLATAGSYLFACDDSGAWVSHYTFDPNGTLVDSEDWNYYSTEYVWSPANQKMYFFRDDTSPNDLLWEQINANGTAYTDVPVGGLGTEIDSPLHDSSGFTHPIRISPDGSVVVLGSGVIHDATSLARLPLSLGNSISDATWLGGDLHTIRTVSGVAQFQQWTGATYAQGLIKQVPGTAYRLLSLSANRLVGVTLQDGVPSFYILDNTFSVVPPATLAAPANLAASLSGSTQVTLTWQDVSGEESFVIERRVGLGGAWQLAGTTGTSVTTFQDAGILSGQTYYYRVAAKNGALLSPSSSVLAVDATIPLAPTALVASVAGSAQINLQWADSANETNYQLDRKTGTNGTWSQIATPAAGQTTYSNTNLTPATQYFYRLRAVNAFGVSPSSAEASATTDVVPPTTPYLYTPSAPGAFTVTLTWVNSSYETSYVLERRLGTTGAWAQIATPSADATSYSDTTVSPSTIYNYRIKALNSAGESAYSTVVSVTTPQISPPAAPTLVARPLGSTQVAVSWTNVTGEIGYHLQRRGDDPASWASIATLDPDVTSFTDAGLVEGKQYFYRVTSFNTSGDSAFSNVDDAITLNLVTWLEDDFDPALGNGWTSVSGATVLNGGSGFLGSNALWFGNAGLRSATTLAVDTTQGGYVEFRIRAGNSAVDGPAYWDNSETGETVVLEYSVDGGAWTSLQAINTVYPNFSTWALQSIEIPAAARGGQTRFRWRQLAHSGVGTDTWALEDVAIKAANPLPPAVPGYLLAAVNSSSAISLAWPLVAGATSYVVERLADDVWQGVATLPGTATGTVVSGLASDTTYLFRVRAGNVGGLSAPSIVAVLRTLQADDDPLAHGILEFASASLVASETPEGGSAQLHVVRTGGHSGTVNVHYHVSSGTATVGTDLPDASGTITFADGQMSRVLSIPLLPDGDLESTESFTVELSDPDGGAALGFVTVATVSILDDEEHGIVAFAAGQSSVAENGGPHEISVTRSGGTSGSITVPYTITPGTAVPGEDFTGSSGTLVFADGQVSASISLEIINDDTLESSETITIELGSPTGGASRGSVGTHVVTIEDDDAFNAGNASYLGLISEEQSQAVRGWVRFKTTRRGGISGRFVIAGTAHPFTGTLDAQGRMQVKPSLLRGLSPLPEGAQLVVHPDGDHFSFHASDSSSSVWTCTGERTVSSIDEVAGKPAAYYTAFLHGAEINEGAGHLRGTASLKLGKSGEARLKAWTPDGTLVTFGGAITISGRIPIAASSKKPGAMLAGSLDFAASTANEIDGDLRWTDSVAGIDEPLTLDAFAYKAPAPGAPVISGFPADGRGSFSLSGGDLASPLEKLVRLTKSSAVTILDPSKDRLQLTIQPTSGMLKGSFRDTSGSLRKLRGIIVNHGEGTIAAAGGLFTTDVLGGSWSLHLRTLEAQITQ